MPSLPDRLTGRVCYQLTQSAKALAEAQRDGFAFVVVRDDRTPTSNGD